MGGRGWVRINHGVVRERAIYCVCVCEQGREIHRLESIVTVTQTHTERESYKYAVTHTDQGHRTYLLTSCEPLKSTTAVPTDGR